MKFLPLAALMAAHLPASTLASDTLLVSGFSSNSVTRYDAAGGAFLGELGPANLQGVLGLTLGPDGLVYVCSESNDSVLRFEPGSGALVDAFVIDDPLTPGDETGGLDGPSAIAFGPDCNAYVASFNSDAILKYDGDTGAFCGVFVQPNSGNLNGPDAGMSFGPDGDLFVPSFYTHEVKRYDGASGAFVMNFVGPLTASLVNPRTILFPGGASAFVASEGNDRVLEVDATTGALISEFIVDDPLTPGDETGGLDAPTGLGFGPDGHLYVASLRTHSVLRYDPVTGAFAGEFVPSGSGGIDFPTALIFVPETTRFCTASVNSTGRGARIGARGFTTLSSDSFTLTASCLPPVSPGVFFYGSVQLQISFGAGVRCVGGTVFRLGNELADLSGQTTRTLDFASPPQPGGAILPGATWHFQYWYGDPAGPTGSTFNLSDALTVSFAP